MVVNEKKVVVAIAKDRGAVPIARDILACAGDTKCSVYIEKGGRTVSGNTMIGILSLGIASGDVLKVTCSGKDEYSVGLCLEGITNILV